MILHPHARQIVFLGQLASGKEFSHHGSLCVPSCCQCAFQDDERRVSSTLRVGVPGSLVERLPIRPARTHIENSFQRPFLASAGVNAVLQRIHYG